MCMIITIRHTILTWIFKIIVLVGPTIFLHWHGAGHINHAACGGFTVGVVVWPLITRHPVGIICINPLSIDIIKFIRLEMIGSRYLRYAFYAKHIGGELSDSGIAGDEVGAMQLIFVSTAKGYPCLAFIVNHCSWVERARTSVKFRSIPVKESTTLGITPGTYRWSGANHTCTSAIGEEHIKMGLPITLFPGNDTRSPRNSCPWFTYLCRLDCSVICPVHHIICRCHDKRLNISIVVFVVLTHRVALLLIISTIYINPAIMNYRSGVCIEIKIQNRIVAILCGVDMHLRSTILHNHMFILYLRTYIDTAEQSIHEK